MGHLSMTEQSPSPSAEGEGLRAADVGCPGIRVRFVGCYETISPSAAIAASISASLL